jgi:hypothetical protein
MENLSKPDPSKSKLIFSAVLLMSITTAFLWAGIKGLVTGSVHAGHYWLMEFIWLGGGAYLGLRTIDAFIKRHKAKSGAFVEASPKVNKGTVMLSLTLLVLVLFLAYVGASHRP